MSRQPWSFALLGLMGAVLVVCAQSGKKNDTSKNHDVQKVERLLAARKEYQASLEELRKHYIKRGDIQKGRLAEDELLQFHRILKHPFRLELDVPPETLKGTYNIPAANTLYRQAMGYKDKGWGTDLIDNQRRAEILLQRMLTLHPQSDKISDAAYQLGDIYESRSYKQFDRAALYFERCYQWNTRTTSDARLRAARLYDRQLNNRGKAAELYRLITKHETDEKRIEEAKKRLQEISQRR